jgi:HEAT repeat protein
VEDTAIDALARIGAPAVPEMINTLRHPDPRMRLRAVEVLGRIGPDASDAVSALVAVLDDEDPQVRKAAIRSLGQIGPDARAAVRPIMRVFAQVEN